MSPLQTALSSSRDFWLVPITAFMAKRTKKIISRVWKYMADWFPGMILGEPHRGLAAGESTGSQGLIRDRIWGFLLHTLGQFSYA